MASKRVVAGRAEGYYRNEDVWKYVEEVKQEDERLTVGDKLEEGVYEVERVLERRKRKGRGECLVLWKGYRSEESSWVEDRLVTATALRTFTEPTPPERVVLDAVSSLCTAIKKSLSVGVVRNCSFSVNFRRDVFISLFGDCGNIIPHRKGRNYDRCDFGDLFRSSDFVLYNKFNEGVKVVFPVYLYSYVKHVKCGTFYDFCETVYVNLIKERC